MMRIISLIALLLLVNIKSFGQVSEIRDELFYNDFDQEQTINFYNKVIGIQNPSPVIIAYVGVAEALLAKIMWNPFSKIEHLRASRDLFSQAIQIDSSNLEIRFLRFSTQFYLPSFLGFSKDLEDDKIAIMEHLGNLNQNELDSELLIFIVDFMGETKQCSIEDLQRIRSKLFREP